LQKAGSLPIAALCCELIRSVAVTAIPRHIRSMDKEIDKGLAAFIATLQGPFGQIPFERAVVRHLPLFLGLRRRGLTWTGVASLLTAARRAAGQWSPDFGRAIARSGFATNAALWDIDIRSDRASRHRR
jgi:hypothetical protein